MNKALEPVQVPAAGMEVICFQELHLYVGRIEKVQRKPGSLELDLLWADHHMPIEDDIWLTYFYMRIDAPRHSGIFKWPGDRVLTFDLSGRKQPATESWLVASSGL